MKTRCGTGMMIFLAFVAMAASLFGSSPSVRAQPDRLIWSSVRGVPESTTLSSVVMLDQTSAWAVGEDDGRGVAYHLRLVGSRWSVELDGSFAAPLRAVAPIADDNVWAAGEGGLIIHRTTAGWGVVESPVPGASLQSIQMLGRGEEGWAAGALTREDVTTVPLLLHYRDGVWQPDRSTGEGGMIASLHFGPGAGWLVQASTIWRYAGGQWAREQPGNPCEAPACFSSLYAVRAITADEAWAVGSKQCPRCPELPYVIHRTGGVWREVLPVQPIANIPGGQLINAVLRGVSFSSEGFGLAVGYQRADVLRPVVLGSWDGSWSNETLPDVSGVLLAVSQADATHALVVGNRGLILSYGYGQQTTPATPPPPAVEGAFADEAFRGVWQRTDQPIAVGAPDLLPRTWIWGPGPLTGGHHEPYAEAPGGTRLVQYFDKSRMEITDPGAARDKWYVTNGLLVVELVSGRLQVGDTSFEARVPSAEPVAGDPAVVNPRAPTYRSLQGVVSRPPEPRQTGQIVTAILTPDGQGWDDSLRRYNASLEGYDAETGRNIPKVFTDFFARQGLVYENGRFVQGQVLDWLFVMGRPISEPYWTRVKVGGVEKDVLIQAFERRVLTYTPDNPQGFNVEMGNVGQHYLRWRYGP